MLQRHRLLVGLAVVAGLGLAVSTFATSPTHQPTNAHEAALLAARYHLRGRTSRFFQRSTPYHPDHGSNRSYRGRPVTSASRPSGVHSEPARGKKGDLAARYHLRMRTTRFFGRAAA